MPSHVYAMQADRSEERAGVCIDVGESHRMSRFQAAAFSALSSFSAWILFNINSSVCQCRLRRRLRDRRGLTRCGFCIK